MLHLLPSLAGKIIIPPAVAAELAAGKKAGVDLPDIAGLAWLTLRTPVSVAALPLVTDLGPGESQVLALALELPGSLVIMDDLLARRVAGALHIPLTGTLGVLLAARRNGLIRDIASILDMLQDLRFRVSSATRAAILKLAAEI